MKRRKFKGATVHIDVHNGGVVNNYFAFGHRVRKHTSKVRVSKSNEDIYPFVVNKDNVKVIIALILKYDKDNERSNVKEVMRPIRAAEDAGVIRCITYEEMKVAFPELCPAYKSSFYKYQRRDIVPYKGPDYNTIVEEFRKLGRSEDKQ